MFLEKIAAFCFLSYYYEFKINTSIIVHSTYYLVKCDSYLYEIIFRYAL